MHVFVCVCGDVSLAGLWVALGGCNLLVVEDEGR